MQTQPIQILVDAAAKKFGAVLAIKPKNDKEYKLVIKRDSPALPELPYMTITGAVMQQDGQEQAAFYWGHYDLTEAHAFATA